jgi:hypothetical protein
LVRNLSRKFLASKAEDGKSAHRVFIWLFLETGWLTWLPRLPIF